MYLLLQCDKLYQNVTTVPHTYSQKDQQVNRPIKAIVTWLHSSLVQGQDLLSINQSNHLKAPTEYTTLYAGFQIPLYTFNYFEKRSLFTASKGEKRPEKNLGKIKKRNNVLNPLRHRFYSSYFSLFLGLSYVSIATNVICDWKLCTLFIPLPHKHLFEF